MLRNVYSSDDDVDETSGTIVGAIGPLKLPTRVETPLKRTEYHTIRCLYGQQWQLSGRE